MVVLYYLLVVWLGIVLLSELLCYCVIVIVDILCELIVCIVGLFDGQDVLCVFDMLIKVVVQVVGFGVGYLLCWLVEQEVYVGWLIEKLFGEFWLVMLYYLVW